MTLREVFSSYFTPTEEQFDRLWDECLFVFDTNIFLGLYRYSPGNKRKLLDNLDQISNRLWVPHQVAFEYVKRRRKVIIDRGKLFNEARNAFKGLRSAIDKIKIIDKERLQEQVKDLLAEAEQHLDEMKEELLLSPDNDPVLEKVDSLLSGKIGPPYSPEKLEEIYKEGDARHARQIPPGWKDAGKEGVAKFGDLVLWFQMIDKAKETKKPLVFVTDEKKEDWWQKGEDGKTLGPHPELISEIRKKAGVSFYMYSMECFLHHAKKHLSIQVDEEVIEEIEEIGRLDEAEELAVEQAKRKRVRYPLYLGLDPLTEGVTSAAERSLRSGLIDTLTGIANMDAFAGASEGFLDAAASSIQKMLDEWERDRKDAADALGKLERQRKCLARSKPYGGGFQGIGTSSQSF